MRKHNKPCGVCNINCTKHIYHIFNKLTGEKVIICARNRNQAKHINPEPLYFNNKNIRRSATFN